MILCLAVSTILTNLDNAINVLRFVKCDNFNEIERIVICQNDVGYDYTEIVDGVTIHYVNSFGLSLSRNKAISLCKAEYIWFLDDDVILCDSFIADFISSKSKNHDLYLGKIQCSDMDRSYKPYKKERLTRLSMLKVSSIEIIVKKSFVKDNNILFDLNMGLGAKYPSGEENIFLLDCFDHNANIFDSNKISIFHPCDEDKRIPINLWRKPGYPESKSIIASRLGFFWGWLFKFRIIVKTYLSGVPLSLSLKILKKM
ncbi:glycosyltransferase [Moritella sp. 36]|uniref:glycosyltransferase n=1 Tax=Moritella sp. 36 TaxID=2746233 RepID=UPI001BA61782|nr:glycosyltransferase [Moritella sp. 36]QUM87890.1 glycosyltransferase [Moritella sp. 36]